MCPLKVLKRNRNHQYPYMIKIIPDRQSVESNKKIINRFCPEIIALICVFFGIILINVFLLRPNSALAVTAHTRISIKGGKTMIVGGRMVCRANRTAAVALLANGVACSNNSDCISGGCNITGDGKCTPCGTVSTYTDVRGTESITYPIANIGTQCWFGENLRTVLYPNGDAIVKGDSDPASVAWNNAATAYYSCPPNTANNAEDCAAATNASKLGHLYQWNTVMKSALNSTSSSVIDGAGPQGICPSGWHLPTHYELATLERSVCALLGKDSATCLTTFPNDLTTTGWLGTAEGTQLRTSTTLGFLQPLSGIRYYNGSYRNRSSFGNLWSASQYDGSNAWYRNVSTGAQVNRNSSGKRSGFSVRCLKN